MNPENPDRGSERARKGLAGTVIKGVSMAAGGYAMAQAINLGVYLVLARLLVPEDFGIFAAAAVLLGFMNLVAESGTAAALIHREERLEEAFSTGFIWTIVGGTGMSLLALAAAPLIGFFFNSSEIGAIAAALSGLVFLRTVNAVPSAILQREFSFLRRMVIEPAGVVAFGAVAIFAAANDMGPWSLVAGQYASAVVDVVLSWALVSYRPKLRLASMEIWRELVAYGRHVLFATMIMRGGEQADTIAVGKFIGEAALGQFRYALRLAITPFQLLLAGASYVLFPAFARIASERDRFRAAILRSLRWMCVLAFPSGLILIPLGVPLATLLFGDAWREAGYAAMGMSLYTGASALGSVAGEALKADGHPDRLTPMHTFGAIVTAVAMLAFVPLGINAIAIGLSLGAIAWASLGFVYVVRIVGIETREVIAEIWPPLCAAVAMALAILPVELLVADAESHGTALGFLILLGEGLLCILVYLAVLAVLAPRTAVELLRGLRRARHSIPAALRTAPDEDTLDDAEAPLPGEAKGDGSA